MNMTLYRRDSDLSIYSALADKSFIDFLMLQLYESKMASSSKKVIKSRKRSYINKIEGKEKLDERSLLLLHRVRART